METKGTVTPISSIFPAEEAEKASKRVLDTIGERQQQLHQLKGFIDDNVGLINLVQKLPEETHHDIMVPFGKAAFFPGQLIHTNEFMVLLGEGFYAERTSKQTVEILKRRGKTLENQVESLKAIMQDLKAEASFFDTTAHESAEGLVEIREDYVQEDNTVSSTLAGNRMSDQSYQERHEGRDKKRQKGVVIHDTQPVRIVKPESRKEQTQQSKKQYTQQSKGKGKMVHTEVFETRCKKCNRSHFGYKCDGTPITCYNCGREGHVNRFCPHPKQNLLQAPVQRPRQDKGKPVVQTSGTRPSGRLN